MRPTTGTMLQQNNNNNYPCLNVSGSTREMLQKCSRASLPFPSRLELGLGDLPLIRGLRAWALCSKNRRKPGGLLGGGQAPTAPPASRGSSTSCPRPADVYLSGEWGRMGYGLPLGLDARQAGIGALITVATLKTSEGNGKTQTQCLFLRTEKGSCLYSTAKPGSGVTTSAASSVVGGWLRGKTGGGGRDILAGRRDNGPTPPAQTGANRVRVRSGRRWRKSGNAAGREKTGLSRERHQRSREDPAGGITVEERQEERDKGGLDNKQFPSPQQDGKRARQEKEGACRSPKCCHNASPKTCTQCGRRAQRRESQEEHEEGESPRRGIPTWMRKEQQNSEEEEEEKEGQCGLECPNRVLAVPNPDLVSKHLQSHSSCDVGELRAAERNEQPKTQTTHSEDSEEEEDTNAEVVKIHTGNTRFYSENPGEEIAADVNGFSDHVRLDQESEEELESVDVEEEQRSHTAKFSVMSNCFEDVSTFSISTAVSTTRSTDPSGPVEGSICNTKHEVCWVQREQEDSKEHLEGCEQGEVDHRIVGKDELEPHDHEKDKNEENNNQLEESEASPPRLRHKDPYIDETQHNGAERRDELVWGNKKDKSEEEDIKERVNPEEGEIWRREEGNDGEEWYTDRKKDDGAIREGNCEEVKRNCALKDNWRLQEKKEDNGEINAETNAANAACADPSNSPALSVANPAPSLPPLGSMATGLPCLEAAEGRVRATAGDGEGGQEGKRNHRRELESPEETRGEEETVATEEGRKEEVEEEDEFGVFMQAEGEPAWSKGLSMSASVPCGSRESVALGNHNIAGETSHWTPSWTDSSFHQSDDTWTAFPQDSSDEGRDVAGQWWPTSAAEERKDGLSANQNLVSLFAEAFPSLPDSSSRDPCDLDTVPTLTQLLRGRASQDQGLLDSFHDLNKMIGQRYKRANGVSRDLLLKTLHLEQPHTESRPVVWTANRRLSPGLPSANQHAQHAAAKRRLSYDYNRNIME